MPEQMTMSKAALLYVWQQLCSVMARFPESDDKREAARLAAWMKNIIDEMD